MGRRSKKRNSEGAPGVERAHKRDLSSCDSWALGQTQKYLPSLGTSAEQKAVRAKIRAERARRRLIKVPLTEQERKTSEARRRRQSALDALIAARNARAKEPEGYVYVWEPYAECPVLKIGFSKSPQLRIHSLRQTCPTIVKNIATRRLTLAIDANHPIRGRFLYLVPAKPSDEWRMHRYFSNLSVGNEFFVRAPRLLNILTREAGAKGATLLKLFCMDDSAVDRRRRRLTNCRAV